MIKQHIEIENFTNASVLIECSDEKIIIDPWFTDGKYLGTWHNFPRVSETYLYERLANVKYCLITHLHKDHFDINAIKKYFSYDTIFLIPKVFGFQVIEGTLKKEGYLNTNVLECSNEVYNTDKFSIRTVPPLNVSGLEAHTDNQLSIDGGFVLVNKASKAKLVFLADDNLYSEERVKENYELINSPDLIAFAYSGFATDYPFNFNFSLKEKIKITQHHEENRFNTQLSNLKLIKPKCIMPYSSEFVPVGKHSKHWHNVLPHIWTSSKKEVTSRYSKALDTKGIYLYLGDKLLIDGERNISADKISTDDKFLSQLRNYYEKESKIDHYKNENENIIPVSRIKSLLKKASSNYLKSLKKYKLHPLQTIIIKSDNNIIGSIDKNGTFEEVSADNNINGNTLLIEVPSYILERLLTAQEHWDDAALSLRLNYERSPNIFCSDTLQAVNYLNVR